MVGFLSLPPEIINYILYDLSPRDLVACQLSNKYLDTTIRESVVLQHNLALIRAYAEDNPLSNLFTADKLTSLRNIEDAWISMRTDFSRTLPVPLRQSGVYDLTGGVYLLSNADRTSLGLLRLPGKEDDGLNWIMYDVGKLIIDVGLCVYEHDLMAIVTSIVRVAPAGTPNTFDIELQLVELSSKKPHPRAQQNPIFVMNSAWEKPAVGIEIVGKHLVLVLSFNARGHPQDRIFIFEWQTGVSVASFEARSHTYSGLVFLDEETILLPNTRNNTLDIYRIPQAPTLESLRPALVLSLPQLIDGRILGFATCRAEPNPIGKDSYPAMHARQQAEDGLLDLMPHRGFFLKASTALCMFELRVHVLEFNIVPGAGLQMGFPFRYSFTFVTQRQALLDLVAAYDGEDNQTSHAAGGEDSTFVLPQDESHEQRLPSTGAPATDQAHGGANGTSPKPSQTTHAPPPTLHYTQWGPDCTAWFGSNENDVSLHWITTSAGRRCVRMGMATGAVPEGERFFICEFGDVVLKRGAGKKEGDEDKGAKDKGKGKAADDGLGEESAPMAAGSSDAGDSPKKTKRPRRTARSIAEEDRLADLEWAQAQRARRAGNAPGSSSGAGPSGTIAGADADHGSCNAGESAGAAEDASMADAAEGSGDDSDADGDVYPPEFWRGGNTVDSYATWVQSQAYDQLEEDAEMEDGDELDDEGHEHYGLHDVHDHLHAHGSENGDDEVPFHGVFTVPEEVAHGSHDYEEPDDREESESENGESWAVDPLPDSGEDTLVVDGERVLDCPEVFREPIQHNLPYIVRGSSGRYRWNGVLLDEERVIGIKATDVGHVEEIEILHFG